MSPEVQNMGISGSIKGRVAAKNFLKKLYGLPVGLDPGASRLSIQHLALLRYSDVLYFGDIIVMHQLTLWASARIHRTLHNK